MCDCFVNWFQAASLFPGTPPPGRDHVQWEHEAFTSQDTVWQVSKRPCCDQSRGSHHLNFPVTHGLETKTVTQSKLHSEMFFKKKQKREKYLHNEPLIVYYIKLFCTERWLCVFYFILPWSRCADRRKRGGGTWIMIIPDIQLPLRPPRGGKSEVVEAGNVRSSVFALKEIECSKHLWNGCGENVSMVCLFKNMIEKQDPQRGGRGGGSTASWYTSGLMLTITLDDFWRESRHVQVINHLVKLFKNILLM